MLCQKTLQHLLSCLVRHRRNVLLLSAPSSSFFGVDYIDRWPGRASSSVHVPLKFRMLGWECIGLLAWFRRQGRGHSPVMGPGGSWASWSLRRREKTEFSKLSRHGLFCFPRCKMKLVLQVVTVLEAIVWFLRDRLPLSPGALSLCTHVHSG